MTYLSLDTIVRSALSIRQYSLHWYVQFLKHAADCLRELTFDTLKNVETKVLPVSNTGIVILPCNYVDWTKVGFKSGQYVSNMSQNEHINRLVNTDTQGHPANYGQAATVYSGNCYNWALFNTCNGFTGGIYGAKGGTANGFKVIPERGEIQLTEGLGLTEIVLEYIGDGSSCDCLTKIHPYAQKAIESYIFWQIKQQNRTYGEGERQVAKRLFDDEHRKLRSRLNELTTTDIINIFNRGKTASLKQ
jgi:hypothetical protein